MQCSRCEEEAVYRIRNECYCAECVLDVKVKGTEKIVRISLRRKYPWDVFTTMVEH